MPDIGSRKFRYIVGCICVFVGSIINIFETLYFGVNTSPVSPLEAQCDYIANVTIVAGLLIMGYVIFIQKKKQT